MSETPNPESLAPADKISVAVSEIHASFLNSAPEFDRNIWVPHKAIEERAGSWAAEAFFVASRLIDWGVCNEQDLFLGVFNNHGEDVQTGLVGRTVKNPGRAILFIVADGQTYELNFRMNRADEKPMLTKTDEDSFSEDRIKWVAPISEAFTRYGEELGDPSGLRLGFRECVVGDRTMDGDDVAFDQEF